MENLTILKNPYDDEVLVFNNETGRYELTLEETKKLFDVMPTKNDSILRRRIKDNSRLIYQYLVNHSCTANRQVINFMINRTEQGRKFIHDVLIAQIESDLEFGTNSLGKIPTVNIQSGQVADRYAVRENMVCLNAESVIDDSVNYFGFNICYMQPYPSGIFMFVYGYTKDN